MDKGIRGIECTLEENGMETFLHFIAEKYSLFDVPWCMVSGRDVDTRSSCNMLPSTWLNLLAHETVLELVLFAYGINALPRNIMSYDDFMNSECRVCLIYYDCGMLEIYIKIPEDFNEIWDKLVLLHAQDMTIKTSSNDARSKLTL